MTGPYNKKSQGSLRRLSFFKILLVIIPIFIVVVVLLFYVHGKHLRSCRDGQLT